MRKNNIFRSALMGFHHIANRTVEGESAHNSSSFSYFSLFGTINIRVLNCLDIFLICFFYPDHWQTPGHPRIAWVRVWPRTANPLNDCPTPARLFSWRLRRLRTLNLWARLSRSERRPARQLGFFPSQMSVDQMVCKEKLWVCQGNGGWILSLSNSNQCLPPVVSTGLYWVSLLQVYKME